MSNSHEMQSDVTTPTVVAKKDPPSAHSYLSVSDIPSPAPPAAAAAAATPDLTLPSGQIVDCKNTLASHTDRVPAAASAAAAASATESATSHSTRQSRSGGKSANVTSATPVFSPPVDPQPFVTAHFVEEPSAEPPVYSEYPPGPQVATVTHNTNPPLTASNPADFSCLEIVTAKVKQWGVRSTLLGITCLVLIVVLTVVLVGKESSDSAPVAQVAPVAPVAPVAAQPVPTGALFDTHIVNVTTMPTAASPVSTLTPTNIPSVTTVRPTSKPTSTPTSIPTAKPTKLLVAKTAPPTEPQSAARAVEVTDFINSVTLSGRTLSIPADSTTVSMEELALQWLVQRDPLSLSPNIPLEAFRLQQRYALKTLWVGRNASDPFGGSTGNECQWDGVICIKMELSKVIGNVSVVKAINWTGFGWNGSLVPDLGLLTHLEHFEVDSNHLTGTLPTAIGLWTKLEYFDVESNKLAGTLPSTIGQWTNLEYVNVESNNFNGTLPHAIGQWTNLKELYTYNNSLTGTLPSSVGNWTNLKVFDVQNNDLNGSLPSGIGNWTHLEDIDVESNQLSGSLPSTIGKWTNLKVVDVQNNFFTGPLPPSIDQWTSLTEAHFSQNNFSGSLPIGLCIVVNLTKIEVDCDVNCSCIVCDCF